MSKDLLQKVRAQVAIASMATILCVTSEWSATWTDGGSMIWTEGDQGLGRDWVRDVDG